MTAQTEAAAHMRAVTEALTRTTEDDTHDRATTRVRMIFGMFYDDEESEPDQAIRDALTDLMHMAAERHVDFEEALSAAARMWTMEREDWEVE
ncbi:hypothetical protein SEA_ZAGIE_78 [Microbacterium phage Zagie]|uniref:Nucleotide pyrophosphohydrolase n=1 Tax=Microbacterium phage Squash TaxID=2182357 RepID=A0A2U8UM62_9CAUD|nr:nucleotide pyrophosphohydrolase [Microbacterium phage Squash]AWN04698.1 nucleotide pyrophosphohydrolase [Microbacterium phage Squash]UVG35431.1 hypothetical protein SEA_ZAGIE_78 [Microbacterium phage Zagie]WNT45328.1 hypothetical protein SEA_BABYDOTZ_75 [Microbacterium phage BabyDotz]